MSTHDDDDHHHPAPLAPVELRAKALEELLSEKGILQPGFLDVIVTAYENDIGPMNGARVVARAWVDPAYRARLLADGTAAIVELGFGGPEGGHVVVVENGPAVHNVVVCTLCSCYPWPILGLPPTWYKSSAYRARAVIDPRGVLSELGLEISQNVEIRTWDSTAAIRYLVLPERPAGTEHLTEEQLAALVPRDAMVGTAKVSPPPETRQQAGEPG